jgi:hypothetical protein
VKSCATAVASIATFAAQQAITKVGIDSLHDRQESSERAATLKQSHPVGGPTNQDVPATALPQGKRCSEAII